MTFTDDQQKEHREAFIRDCRQKAWGARCHAEWIGKQMDELMAQYTKLSDEHRGILAEIDTLKDALDSHTVDNRNKRKELQAKADTLAKQMQAIGASAHEGHKAMAQLYASVESSLALAAHAEGWSWKDIESQRPVEPSHQKAADL